MKLFVLNDTVVSDILNSLTIKDELRKIVETIILRFDYSFSNFIYSMFSVYTTYYVQLTDHNCNVSYREAEVIYNNLTKTNLNINRNNVFIVDIYDILYVTSTFDRIRFNCHFYEDMYNRMENLFGTEVASDNLDELFDALEIMFSIIEENLISNIIECDNNKSNIIIYLELNVHGLMIYII